MLSPSSSGLVMQRELDGTDAIVRVHLLYFFLSVVAMAGSVVEVQVILRGLDRVADPERSLASAMTA